MSGVESIYIASQVGVCIAEKGQDKTHSKAEGRGNLKNVMALNVLVFLVFRIKNLICM